MEGVRVLEEGGEVGAGEVGEEAREGVEVVVVVVV